MILFPPSLRSFYNPVIKTRTINVQWGGGGEGFLRRRKRRRHLPKVRTFKKFGNVFFGQIDQQTDRQTDIVAHREVTFKKNSH